MKKIVSILLSMLLVVNLGGCSLGKSEYWISSNGTNIYIDGKQAMLTEFNGEEGIYEVDGDPMVVKYKKCVKEVRDCPENRQGVHEADLSEYKKANYFDAYIYTYSCMHAPLDDSSTVEATMTTSDKELSPLENDRAAVYDTMIGLKFEPLTKAMFDDCIKINSNGNGMIVRNTDITIPGVLAVTKGEKDCTQQVSIGDITVMKYESNNFDFYQYEGNLIKVAKGVNVEEYITIEPSK